jgi:hypothetical protein
MQFLEFNSPESNLRSTEFKLYLVDTEILLIVLYSSSAIVVKHIFVVVLVINKVRAMNVLTFDPSNFSVYPMIFRFPLSLKERSLILIKMVSSLYQF